MSDTPLTASKMTEKNLEDYDVMIPPVPAEHMDRGGFPMWSIGWTAGYLAGRKDQTTIAQLEALDQPPSTETT